MKKIAIVLLALLLTMSNLAALAANVNYEGGAEKFVFLPGSELSDTDLFENFKGVLPGDVLEQKITVKNDTKKSVRLYLRAEPVSEADRDFLSQLHLTVTSGNKTLFDAAASEQDGLAKNTLLGTFKSKGETELTVTLTVPAELANEYMNQRGDVPWTFLAEEIKDTDDTPETGDWFRMGAWALAAVALAAVIAVVAIRKRKEA